MTRDGSPLGTIATALRRERDRAGFSLTELARRAGIAKSTVSQLEAGTGNPSVETLWALATTLQVPFSRLVDPPVAPVRVVRAGEGPAIPSETGNYTAVLLASCPPGARRDIYVISLEPGEPRKADSHIPGTVEHVVVTAGMISAGPAEAPVELEPGDYASFPGDVPHAYQALQPASAAVLVMEHV